MSTSPFGAVKILRFSILRATYNKNLDVVCTLKVQE